MTAHIANAIYDLLVQHAGADDRRRAWSARQEFVWCQKADGGCKEYRFQGHLGFGGKFYIERERWRVGCYREDDTPERLDMIERTNAALSELYATQQEGT